MNINIKVIIIIALLAEGLFLFFTTKAEQKLKAATTVSKSTEGGVFSIDEPQYIREPNLTKRVDVDLNSETVGRFEDEYEEVPNNCPDEFTFELYSYLDEEATSRRKNWEYTIKDGLFGYKNKKLTSIPISILDEPCFKGLDFSINRLTEFPTELYEVTNLRLLNLSNNRITKVDHIGKFPNLDYLDLSSNKITEVGDGIAALKNLRHLNLRSNYNLEKISKRIFELKGTLKVLNIKNTKLARNKPMIEILKLGLPDTELIYK